MQVGIFDDLQNGKTVPVTQEMVLQAYRSVKNKGKQCCVDEASLLAYQEDLKNNLYKLWNRLASGSYYPPPVREVAIPKGCGKGERKLGIAPLSDKVGQMVVKKLIEPRLEAVFLDNSYGYRPGKRAHDALKAVRKHCFTYGWVIDLDIKGYFDNIDHELLMRALAKHVDEKWIQMYIRRWLEAPVLKANGEHEYKAGKGTPQGGVLSPLLANLFLHYVLDMWLKQHYPRVKFVRYADDVIIHCENEEDAKRILSAVGKRLAACKLQLNEEKTGIVYCKDYKRPGNYPVKKFEFLGYSFQPREIYGSVYKRSLGFVPAISQQSQRKIRQTIGGAMTLKNTTTEIEKIAQELNAQLRGWINYYGKYRGYVLSRVFRSLDKRLMKWLKKKYKSLKGSVRRAWRTLERIYDRSPALFEHWRLGYSYLCRLSNKSRVR